MFSFAKGRKAVCILHLFLMMEYSGDQFNRCGQVGVGGWGGQERGWSKIVCWGRDVNRISALLFELLFPAGDLPCDSLPTSLWNFLAYKWNCYPVEQFGNVAWWSGPKCFCTSDPSSCLNYIINAALWGSLVSVTSTAQSGLYEKGKQLGLGLRDLYFPAMKWNCSRALYTASCLQRLSMRVSLCHLMLLTASPVMTPFPRGAFTGSVAPPLAYTKTSTAMNEGGMVSPTHSRFGSRLADYQQGHLFVVLGCLFSQLPVLKSECCCQRKLEWSGLHISLSRHDVKCSNLAHMLHLCFKVWHLSIPTHQYHSNVRSGSEHLWLGEPV